MAAEMLKKGWRKPPSGSSDAKEGLEGATEWLP